MLWKSLDQGSPNYGLQAGCVPWGPLIQPVEAFLSTEKKYGNLRVSSQDQPPLTWTLCFYQIKIEACSSALCFPTDHYIAKPYLLLTFSTSVHRQWDDITAFSGGAFKWFPFVDYLIILITVCQLRLTAAMRRCWCQLASDCETCCTLFSDNFLHVITYQCV